MWTQALKVEMYFLRNKLFFGIFVQTLWFNPTMSLTSKSCRIISSFAAGLDKYSSRVSPSSKQKIFENIYCPIPARHSNLRRPLERCRCLSLLSSIQDDTRNQTHAFSINSDTNHSNGQSRFEQSEETISAPKEKLKKDKSNRQKRRERFIGLAKAVDRGQNTVYRPLNDEGNFQALSGLPDRRTPFVVLGIESSCDDTGAAVVRSDGTILGEALKSQNDIHEQFGGVVPGLARDAHQAAINIVVQQALDRAQVSFDQIDAIGVTVGPGLEICLRVGCRKAQELALQHNKTFVAVHHLEAHILMSRLPQASMDPKSLISIPATEETHESKRALNFPFLALLVSGGHCQLLRCEGIGQYEIMGGTLDDSLGEAFDKVARMLELPGVGGGGGPAVEKLALQGDAAMFPLPVPMQNRPDCDFSFSGLKTSIRTSLVKLRRERQLDQDAALSDTDKANVAASFQNVAIAHIEQRVRRCMTRLEGTDIQCLAVVGGVAANQALRGRLQALCDKRGWSMFVPPPRLCTDQGAMSAWAAIERLMLGSSDDPHTQEVFARYPFFLDRSIDIR